MPPSRTALALVSTNASNPPGSGAAQAIARTSNNGNRIAISPIAATAAAVTALPGSGRRRSEEHTSELQSLMRISYAVFCLKKKTEKTTVTHDGENKNNTTQKSP